MNSTRHLIFLAFAAIVGCWLWKRYKPRNSLDDHFEEQSLLQQIGMTAQGVERNVEPVIAAYGTLPWVTARLGNPYGLPRTTDSQSSLKFSDCYTASTGTNEEEDDQVWTQENLNNTLLFGGLGLSSLH